VKLRDRGICYMCENVEPIRELNAHHIYPKANYKNIKKVYKLDNGISLCWSCHRELVHTSFNSHNKYIAMFRNRMRNKSIKKFNKVNQERIK